MRGFTRVSALLVWAMFSGNAAAQADHLSAIWDCPPGKGRPPESLAEGSSFTSREKLVDLRVNGAIQDRPVYIFVSKSGGLFIADCDFKALRLRARPLQTTLNQVTLIPLSGQDWVKAELDETQDRLDLTIDPVWFELTQIDLSKRHPSEALNGGTGATLNYVLQLTEPVGRATQKGLTLDGAMFGRFGYFENNAQFAWTTDAFGRNTERRIRLNSRWFIDQPESRQSLQIGDGATQGSIATPALRYAGLSFGSNFDLDPGFSPYASVFVAGSARAPSTADLLLNDRRIGPSIELPAGQFRLDRIPTVDGAGMVRVLIRDVLGNEQTLALPYFKSSRLYAPGVHQHSSTIGAQRLDYEQYDRPFALTVHRFGVTDSLTVEASGSIDEDRRSVGIGASFRLAGAWISEVGAAASDGPLGSGNRFELLVSRQIFQEFGVGFSVLQTSRRFSLIGDDPDINTADAGNTFGQHRERQLTTLYATRHLGRFGALSLSHMHRTNWNDPVPQRLTTLGWGKSFARGVSVGISFSDSRDSQILLAGLSISLDPRSYVHASLNSRQPRGQQAIHDLSTEYLRALPSDEGFGGRIGRLQNLTHGSDPQVDPWHTSYMSGHIRSTIGLHSMDVEDREGRQSWRAQTAGAIGWIQGVSFLSPPIRGSFAVVSTKDADQIPIYRENNRVTQTNQRGIAIVTPLRPFESNRLSIQPDEIPLQYSVGEAIRQVTPHTRGGVFVEFDLNRESAAVLQLTDASGSDLPRGAVVTIQETREESIVGLRGEAYITNLPNSTTIRISHSGEECQIQVRRPGSKDPQPRIGPLVCNLQRPSIR